MARQGSSSEQRAFWASAYDGRSYRDLPWFEPTPSAHVARAVSDAFLPAGASVLDVGCGAGSNVLFLARNGFDAHGIDLSPGAISAALERAREEKLSPGLRVGDALALEFPAARFDGLIDNGCFHTLPLASRATYAREVSRVLRPGGVLLLSWVAREHTTPWGPPHRPSLAEVTKVLERDFLFVRTEFHRGADGEGPSTYDARLVRRTRPQPPPR